MMASRRVGTRCTLLALCVRLALGLTEGHDSPTPHPHSHEHIPFPSEDQNEDDYPMINLGWDVEHIKADLGRLGLPNDKLDNLTEEDMDFYFFTLHDFDNNTKLDGNEIIKAMTHTIGENIDNVKARPKISEDKMMKHIEYIYTVMYGMADQVLEMADTDFDGYITYAEFMTAKHSHKEVGGVEEGVEEGGEEGGEEGVEEGVAQGEGEEGGITA